MYLNHPLEDPAAWRGDQLAGRSDWIIALDDGHRAELAGALLAVGASGLGLFDASQDDWFEAVFLRDNPKGWHQELWHHVSGCRSWFKVLRNTHSHKILASAKLDEELPDPASFEEAGR